MNRRYHSTRLQCMSGLTLIELMIAMVLNLTLLAGAFSIYISNQSLYRTGEGLAQVQENLRIASDYLNRGVRMAGSGFSCSDIDSIENLLKTPDAFSFDYEQIIVGYNNGENLPTELQGKVLENTDVLVLRGGYGTGARLEGEMNNSSATLKTTVIDPAPFETGDVVAITDCRSASIFQITNYTNSNGNVVYNTGSNTPGNISKNFSRSYPAGASVIKTRTLAYYIGENEFGQAALFQYKNEGNSSQEIEIVDGIENMQLTFSEDRDDDGYPDGYYSSNDIVSWDKVVSARFELLASSQEGNLLESPAEYTLNDQKVIPKDRKIYHTTSFVTAIRGRLR